MRKNIIVLFVFCLSIIFLYGCTDKEKGNTGKIEKIKDLNSAGFTIGCMTGIMASNIAQTKLPKAHYKEYSMPIDAFTAICSNKIDAVVLDRPTLEFMSLAHPDLAVMQDDLAIGKISVATAKKNTELMKQVNNFIRRYRKNGTYKDMYNRWFRSGEADMPKISPPEQPNGILKVGVTANNEPLCFIKNGKMAGFDSEFSLRLAAYLNKEIKFVDLPYDALVIGLESGKIDLAVAFMDAMPEREENVLFSEYYIDAPITFLVRRSMLKNKRGQKISSLKELNDPSCVLAVQTEILATKEAKKHLPNAKYIEYNNPPDCYVALSSGKVNGIVYDRPALEYAALERPDFFVLPENIATGHISVGAAKSQKKLLEKVNKFILEIRKDGTYKDMYKRWILSKNADMPEIKTPEKPDGTLVVGVDAVNPPMCFVQDNTMIGYDIEFSKRLALYLNMEINFKSIPYDGLVAALKGNKIDLAIAQMDATPEREDSILFSKEYIDSPIAVMIRKKDYAGSKYMKLRDLKGARIGTLTGAAYDLLAKDYIPEYQSFTFQQINQAVAALESQKIDAFFYDDPLAGFLLMQRPKLTSIPEKIPSGDLAMAFPKKATALCNAISNEIRKMKQDGTLKQLQDKWFSLDESKHIMAKPIASEKKLTFAVVPEFQPFVYIKDGKIIGYDVEIGILAANRLGYQLKVIPTNTATFIEMINTGKADFAGGVITITKERQESVLFSEPTYKGGISLIVCKNIFPGAESHSLKACITDMFNSLNTSFEKTFVRESRWKLILQGLFTTLVITFFSVLFGTVLAFPVCMMCRSKRKILSWLGDRYVSLIMGTPILVILMILYYVIFAKVDINGVVVAIIAFALDFAAYTSVTLSSGIDGIPRGQTEAALALGHSPAASFFYFVLPQAIRTIMPVYRGEIISTLKSTSVVGYIAIMDLTKMGDIIRSRTYEAFFPLIAIALIYYLSAKCLTGILIILEQKLDPEMRRNRLQKRGAK